MATAGEPECKSSSTQGGAMTGSGSGHAAGAGPAAGSSISYGSGVTAAWLKESAKRYSGIGKLARLQFVADRCSEELKASAYELLLDYIKSDTLAVEAYLEAMKAGHQYLIGSRHEEIDAAWVSTTRAKADQGQGRGEHDLNAANASMIQASQRIALMRLGTFYEGTFGLHDAVKNFRQAINYSMSREETLESCMGVIRSSMFTRTGVLRPFLNKAQSTSEHCSRPILTARVTACSGIAEMTSASFASAAQVLLSIAPGSIGTFNSVTTEDDIAIYAGLCALATMKRAQLRKQVLSSKLFSPEAGLAPVVRRAIEAYCKGEYAACLGAVNQLRPYLRMDIFIGDHVDDLITGIEDAAIVQYFAAFSVVSLQSMATAFGLGVPELEEKLIRLITQDKLQARIDSYTKTLRERYSDNRAITYKKAFEAGDAYIRDARALLFRINLDRAGVKVASSGRKGGGERRGGGGMDMMDEAMELMPRGNPSRAMGMMNSGGGAM